MRFLKEDTLHPRFKKQIGREYKQGRREREQFDDLVSRVITLVRKYDRKNMMKLAGLTAKQIERELLAADLHTWRQRLARLFNENRDDKAAADLTMDVFFDLKDGYPAKHYQPKFRRGIERANKAFYVVHYTEAPAYEPAEGGYYYPTREAASSEGFDTREQAEARAREWAEEIRDIDGREMVEIEHGYLFPSKYIGDEEYIMIEPNREYLSREAGRQIYEDIHHKPELAEFKKALVREFRANEMPGDIYDTIEGVEVEIRHGDWKHEHGRVEDFIIDYAMDNGYLIDHEAFVHEDEDGMSDTYSATHYFRFTEDDYE